MLEKLFGNKDDRKENKKLRKENAELKVQEIKLGHAIDELKARLEGRCRQITQLKEVITKSLSLVSSEVSEINSILSEIETPLPKTKEQDPNLLKSFEEQLNSSTANCRGGCTILDPKTGKTEDKMFASRKEAEDLLKKFKSGKLQLVA